MGRTFSPKLSGSLFDLKAPANDGGIHDSDPDFNLSRATGSNRNDGSSLDNSKNYPLNEAWSKTDGAALAKAFKQGQ